MQCLHYYFLLVWLEAFVRRVVSCDSFSVLRHDGKCVRYLKIKNLQSGGSACQYYDFHHFWDSYRQDVWLGVALRGKSATNTKVSVLG